MLRAIGRALVAPTPIGVPGALQRYLYLPTVPTTIFQGPDSLGNPLVLRLGLDSCDFYLNGVRLILEADYMLATNQVELVQAPVTAPSTVELIVLADNRPTYPLTTTKINTPAWTIDGVATQFPLIDQNNVPVLVASPSDMIVSIDGVCQEPFVDFTLITIADETDIIFASPLQPDQTIWAVAGTPLGGGGGGIFYSPTPPIGPVNGQAWATPSAQLFIWDSTLGTWLQLVGATA